MQIILDLNVYLVTGGMVQFDTIFQVIILILLIHLSHAILAWGPS